MSDVVQRARELLAGITPGPWRMGNRRHPDVVHTKSGCLWHPELGFINHRPDGEFIAAAPQLVAELADKLAEVRQIIADDDARGAMPDFITLDKIRKALEADHG